MSDNFKNFKNGYNLKPLAADPTNPKEGDVFRSNGTSRAIGIWEYKSGAWSQIGGGSGGGLDSFYTEDFETSVSASDFTTGNNATFDNGGTIDGTLADETSSPLAGDSSLKYTMSSASTNDWVKSPLISIDDKQSGNVVGLTLYLTYNGDDDDIKIIGYDETGSEVLTTAADFIKSIDNPNRFSVQVPIPSTATQIAWGFQVVTGNSGKILTIDDVEFSTNPFVFKDTLLSNRISLSNSDGRVITSATEDIYFAGSGVGWVGGVDNAPSYYEVQFNESDLIINTAFNFTTASIVRTVDLYKNGVIFKRGGNYDGNGVHYATFLLVAGDVTLGDNLSIRTNSGSTLIGGDTDHYLTILETVQSESIVAYNSRNAANSEIKLQAGNGFGSTNTVIRRYSNIIKNVGNDLILTQSSTLGDFITVGSSGVYFASVTDVSSSSVPYIGITVNSTQLTTNVTALSNPEEAIAIDAMDSTGNNIGNASGPMLLEKGDIIRAHFSTPASVSNSATQAVFTVIKIGVGDLLGVPKPLVGYVKDVKGAGGSSGTFTAGALRTRDLNTTTGDFSKFGTLASNQITLNAGKYVLDAKAPAFFVLGHQAVLYDITGSTVKEVGSSGYGLATGTGVNSHSFIHAEFTLTETTTFEIQHRSQGTYATHGFGLSVSFGLNIEYTQVKITKLV